VYINIFLATTIFWVSIFNISLQLRRTKSNACLIFIDVLSRILAGVALIIASSCASISGPTQGHFLRGAFKKKHEQKVRTMGLGIHIDLFNYTRYKEEVLPAYRHLTDRNDAKSMIHLLREISQKLGSRNEEDRLEKELYGRAIGILEGSIHYDPDILRNPALNIKESPKQFFVKRQIGYKILEAICIPRSQNIASEFDMSQSPLVRYLYKHSEWIEDIFTFAEEVRGGELEIPLGESSELFTKQEIQEFNAHLERVPPPDDANLKEEYTRLRALVKLAMEDPDLTLVLSVR
jgi:hypothetical protein